MDYKKIEKDVFEVVKKHYIKSAREFLGGVENEGLVYYVTNFWTQFEKDEIFREGLELPFYEAIIFLENVFEKCEIMLDESKNTWYTMYIVKERNDMNDWNI